MFKSTRLVILALASALLAGCSTTYVQISSDPQGATISNIDGTETYGEAPIEIPYDKSKLEADSGKVPGFKATWKSGATKSTDDPYIVRDTRFGAKILLKRPENAPNENIDLRYALDKAEAQAKALKEENEKLRTDWRSDPIIIFPGPVFVH